MLPQVRRKHISLQPGHRVLPDSLPLRDDRHRASLPHQRPYLLAETLLPQALLVSVRVAASVSLVLPAVRVLRELP